MLALDKKKLSITLVGFWESAAGELWVDMKRGNEEKKLVIGYGWLEDVWESARDYYMDNEGWSEEKFYKYWEDGGEDREIDEYIAMTVDNYDDELNWADLEGVE